MGNFEKRVWRESAPVSTCSCEKPNRSNYVILIMIILCDYVRLRIVRKDGFRFDYFP